MQINRTIKWCMLGIIGTLISFSIFVYTRKAHPVTTKENSKAELYFEIEGYLAWKAQQRINPASDVEAFIRGVRKRATKTELPNAMSMDEMHALTSEVEFESHKEKILENLQYSEEFLLSISKKPNVNTLIEKQLYYELLSTGSGPPLVKPSQTYLFHYTVSDPKRGELFNTRTTPRAQKICLDCVVPGFAQGVLGMRKGERRKLYIHPQLGFRTMHWIVQPNIALIIDVELISDSSNSTHDPLQTL